MSDAEKYNTVARVLRETATAQLDRAHVDGPESLPLPRDLLLAAQVNATLAVDARIAALLALLSPIAALVPGGATDATTN